MADDDEACGDEASTERLQADLHADEAIARSVRGRYLQSVAWRAGAAERRATEEEQMARDVRRSVLSSGSGDVAEAARSFGLDLVDGDALSVNLVKERWRELALQRHPDIAGGGGETFLGLKRHYQVLLQACRSQRESVVLRDEAA